MRTRLVPILAALAAGALGLPAGGCTVTTHPLYPDVGSFCVAEAKAVCQIAARCAISKDGCEAYQTSVCNAATAQSQTATRVYSPDNAKTCVDAVSAAYGNNASEVTYSQLEGPGSIADKCGRVFTGNAAKYSNCTTDNDCADTLVCAPAGPGSALTVCATPVMVPSGSACQDPGDECPPDFYCAPGTVAKCLPAQAQGMACSDGVPCVSTQHCVANMPPSPQGSFCQPRLMGGVPCLSNDDCQPCLPGEDCSTVDAFCDPYAGKCTVGYTFATGATDCNGIGGELMGTGVGVADAGAE